MSQNTAYADFRAKQVARKAAAEARIKAKTVYQEKEESAKTVPNNLKVIANFTVGAVQATSDVTVKEENNGMKEWSIVSNKIQGVTPKENVSYIVSKSEEGVEKYVLTDNFEVYAEVGKPNKLIVVTTEKELGSKVGIGVIATIQNKINEVSEVGGNSNMGEWAIVSNKIQGVTEQDDVAYILVKDGEGVEKYVLTDNFEVYNELGKPNKLIVVTTANEVLNVPVVEESSESSESEESESSEDSESSEAVEG